MMKLKMGEGIIIGKNVKFGKDVAVWNYVVIGDNTVIGDALPIFMLEANKLKKKCDYWYKMYNSSACNDLKRV